jgi:TM2 domain-containing membrane protein YozV
MKRSTKAVLLSALVFPGLGHLYLKRWAAGVVLFGVAAYAIYTIASVTMSIAMEVVHKIESNGLTPDIDTITALVTQQLNGSEQATNMATIAFAACWFMGVFGSYIHGRAQDKHDATPGVKL